MSTPIGGHIIFFICGNSWWKCTNDLCSFCHKCKITEINYLSHTTGYLLHSSTISVGWPAFGPFIVDCGAMSHYVGRGMYGSNFNC